MDDNKEPKISKPILLQQQIALIIVSVFFLFMLSLALTAFDPQSGFPEGFFLGVVANGLMILAFLVKSSVGLLNTLLIRSTLLCIGFGIMVSFFVPNANLFSLIVGVVVEVYVFRSSLDLIS